MEAVDRETTSALAVTGRSGGLYAREVDAQSALVLWSSLLGAEAAVSSVRSGTKRRPSHSAASRTCRPIRRVNYANSKCLQMKWTASWYLFTRLVSSPACRQVSPRRWERTRRFPVFRGWSASGTRLLLVQYPLDLGPEEPFAA